MAVLQQHAEAGIRQDFLDYAVHFNQFFLGHDWLSLAMRHDKLRADARRDGQGGWR